MDVAKEIRKDAVDIEDEVGKEDKGDKNYKDYIGDKEDKMEEEDSLESYYFIPEKEIICGIEVPPITEDYVENYPSVVDRFFTRYYYIKPGVDAVPYQVLMHSNRICLICLPPEHPALKAGISKLTFDVGNMDRSKNTVSGKKKRGAMPLQADSTLALLTSEEGKTYKVPSCVRGKLIEVNVDLTKEPKRLETAREGEGFLAIILPKPEHCDNIKASLLTQEQYNKFLNGIEYKEVKGEISDNKTNKELETQAQKDETEPVDEGKTECRETELLADDEKPSCSQTYAKCSEAPILESKDESSDSQSP